MKKKIVKFENYRRNIKPNAQWDFGTTSPFAQVSTPKALFVAIAGTLSPVSEPSIAMGTMEVCRRGESDPVKYNFNQYIFYSTGTQSLLEIVETNPPKLLYHWTNSYPSHIQGAAPEWVKDLLDE